MTQLLERGGYEADRGCLLRICFISRALPIHRLGGLEYHLRDLAVALARRGHDIHILTTCGGTRDELVGVENVSISEIPGTQPGDYSIGFFLRVRKAARDVCAQRKIDLVCPIDLVGLFLAPADFTAIVAPIIHGTMTSEVPLDWRYWPHLGFWEKLFNLWRYKSRIALWGAFQQMLQRMDSVIVDSEFTRRELMLTGGSSTTFRGLRRVGTDTWSDGLKVAGLARKICVVPLGIDAERYPAPVAGGGADVSGKTIFRICMLGRLQKIKGIEQAIYGAQALSARGVDFVLTIGGSGEFADTAQTLVNDLGLEGKVRFAGRVKPEDLSEFFSGQDVFLFPDLTQPAFGLVAVEAMYYGLPVVAANVGAVSEVVGDCGWFYDAWDVGVLAGLLARLAGNPEEMAQKTARAGIRCGNFTAEKMAQRMEVCLLEILGD